MVGARTRVARSALTPRARGVQWWVCGRSGATDGAAREPCSGCPARSALLDDAEARADALLRAALAETTGAERRRAQRLGRFLADPAGRELLFALTDEVLRTDDDAPRRCAGSRRSSRAGLPARARAVDRAGLRLAALGAPVSPALVARASCAPRVKAETRGVILPAADPAFAAPRRAARGAGHRLQRQPARRGDPRRRRSRRPARRGVPAAAAARRAVRVGEDLRAVRQPRRARVRPLGRRASSTACAACSASPPRPRRRSSCTSTWRSTATSTSPSPRSAPCSTSPSSARSPAGIALQAYLPDSLRRARRPRARGPARAGAAGGAPVKVRIVKGANLAMEQVDAELAGWPQAPYRDQGRRRRQLQAHARPRVRRGRGAAICASASPATTCSTSRGR